MGSSRPGEIRSPRSSQWAENLFLPPLCPLGKCPSVSACPCRECFSLLGLYVAYVLACVLTGQIARLCCGTDRKPRRKRPLGKVITEAMGEDWLEAHLSPAPSLSAPLASAWSNSDPSAPSAPIRSPPSVHVASSPPPRASAPDGTFPLHEMAAGAALEADANGTARACEQEDSSRRELLKVQAASSLLSVCHPPSCTQRPISTPWLAHSLATPQSPQPLCCFLTYLV